jgi:succinate-semialdehyde dehydrogenase/glutarate-semialdehyde dehydrogenase
MGSIAASPAGTIVSVNPATGQALGNVPEMSADEVQAAVARARAAQASWAATPLRERCHIVRAVAAVLVDRADEIVDVLVKEVGKTRHDALAAEVIVVADLVRYFCKRAPEILAREKIPLHLLKHRASYLHFVPRGVVAVISPWNFPFAIPMGEVLMALIAGNAAVLKPSEVTPLVALKAKELVAAAGVPADLFQVVTGRGATGAALLDAGINYCVFTGSVATGRRIAAACGERLIPCTLELGGKAPVIVCADADLDRTASAIVWGGFANTGQVCCSVERVYAVDEIHDRLVEKIVEKTRALRQGDPSSDGEIDVGAMAWDRQRDQVEAMVNTAVAQGAVVQCGATRGEGPGLFYAPTVLTSARQDMEIMRREIFGPVVPIMRVGSEDEAVALANDSALGLLAYVFSRDTCRARRIAEQIEAGTVMINDVLNTFGCPETPWGGVKASGIGRTHSAAGLRDLCEQRHINYDRIAMSRELWWYPYTAGSYKLLRRGMRLLFSRSWWRRR